MNDHPLKSQATKGVFWSAIEKLSIQLGQLVIGIILARILMPEDFGLIGMLSIFIAFSQSFIDSGMGTGLIQKKNRSHLDYSTVFVFNLVVSSLFYLLLFFTAPLIADFYNKPQLVILTRVLGSNLIISSLAIIQQTKFTIDLDFKTMAKVNAISVIIGGAAAILFAYYGWGVWALVFQNLIRSAVTVLMLWFFNEWKFSFKFSQKSFKDLFGFGSKLLIAGLYAQAYHQLYNVAIGKTYSATELGYYTRAKTFADLTAGTVSGILHKVTYPILASLQDDKDRLISVYKRLIRMTAFFVFPSMTLLALLADPFIRLLLTDKWESVIVLLQWMCFARFVYPISALNMNILNATGRSDLFLKVDLSKAPLLIIALLITIPMGVKAMVIGHVVISLISFFINAYMPGKLYGYGGIQQFKDLLPVIVAVGIMSFFVFISIFFIENYIIKLVTGSILGLITYSVAAYLLKIEELKEVKSLVRKVIYGDSIRKDK